MNFSIEYIENLLNCFTNNNENLLKEAEKTYLEIENNYPEEISNILLLILENNLNFNLKFSSLIRLKKIIFIYNNFEFIIFNLFKLFLINYFLK